MSHIATESYAQPRLAPLLTVNETAAILGVARSTVFRLIRQGDLRSVRVGKRQRFSEATITAYLEREAAP